MLDPRAQRRTIRNAMTSLAFNSVAIGAALVTAGAFLCVVGDLLRHGVGRISWSFFVSPVEMAGRAGGIGPILVSTVLILLVTVAVALPVSLATAMLLAEFVVNDGFFGRIVRRSLDVLAGVPSIVFGLFGNALFCHYLGLRFSILSGGLTLACMALPLMIRAAEEGFRSVPDELRIAAAALGLSRTATTLRIVLPLATPGIIAGLVLGIGRALAETAALIYTSGYVDRMPRSLFDSGRSLSVHIYDLAMNVPGGNPNDHASALILVALLMLINLATHAMAHWSLRRGLMVERARR